MDRRAQKRKAHHLRTQAARQNKFIALYIMQKNKDAYNEAKNFYDQLDAIYGTKRDLTKTNEFMYKTTGYSVHQMYQMKYKTKKNNPGPKNQKEIEVNIPLMNQSDVDINQKEIEVNIPLMNQSDVDIAVMSEKVNEGISIPDSVYNELLDEISKDPTMRNIFGELNQEQPAELDQIFDGILLNERSPLEDELENIVYE